jgi:RsmE family RNA methyltransferase
MNLILFTPEELGKPLSHKDERAVHLLKVLRKTPGDHFDAGVLDGAMGTGTIDVLSPAGIVFSLSLAEDPPPRTPLRLGVGFPRPIQLKRLLRDCSSLGLEAVDLFGTELGEKSYRDTRLLHDGGARAALLEGAAQARDTRLPSLEVYRDLAAWLGAQPWQQNTGTGRAASQCTLFAADNVRPAGTFGGLGALRSGAVLAVGAERGWSSRERDMLDEAGFVRLSMGKRALRTETACVAASVLLMEKMDLV